MRLVVVATLVVLEFEFDVVLALVVELVAVSTTT